MILDKLENAELYQLSAGLLKGIEYLKTTDLNAINEGTYDLNDGIKVIVNLYESKLQSECKPEAHQKYIDIQYIVSGEELIGYAPLGKQKITIDKLEEKDVIFFDAETSLHKLTSGMFAIYFPTDIHQPGVQVNDSISVKKIVIKIPV